MLNIVVRGCWQAFNRHATLWFRPPPMLASAAFTHSVPRLDLVSAQIFATPLLFSLWQCWRDSVPAGLVASFPAAWVTTKRGRKLSMIIAGACYMTGCVILTAAEHLSMLYVGRVMLGCGVGFAIQVIPSI